MNRKGERRQRIKNAWIARWDAYIEWQEKHIEILRQNHALWPSFRQWLHPQMRGPVEILAAKRSPL